ncbi:hypothetical protein MUG91_G72n57 [Manis pentadactyla]|nr:hypothetical protein MUG91_G72n57 [Manis pentadactyla]
MWTEEDGQTLRCPGRLRLSSEQPLERGLPGSSALQHQRRVSEHCQPSQCPCCSVLPDLRGQSLNFQNSLKKILLHQMPALGPLRRDHSQFTTVKKANHRPQRNTGSQAQGCAHPQPLSGQLRALQAMLPLLSVIR